MRGGGYNGDLFATCYFLDPVAATLVSAPTLPTGMDTFCMLKSGGDVYVAGGRHSDGGHWVYRLPQDGKAWVQVVQLSYYHDDRAAAIFDGSLVVIGGAGSSRVDSVNMQTGAITQRASYPTDVPLASAVVYNGMLYCCGGQVATTSCNVLTSLSGSWSTGPEMVQGRWGFSLVVVQGDLYAVGGVGGEHSVERLNSTSGHWELLDGQLADYVYEAAIVSLE